MNIESSNINRTSEVQTTKSLNSSNPSSSTKFSDELNELKETQDSQADKESKSDKKVNQSEDNNSSSIKNPSKNTDNKEKGETLINKDLNIQENKDIMPQMNPNMNFGSSGQPFSSFMNNSKDSEASQKLATSAKELAEEAAILSTMVENIAIANRNQAITRQNSISKIENTNSEITEICLKFDAIIMNQADVEVFNNLVNKNEVTFSNLTSESIHKSTQISKTLADMLAKTMENNQPLRIDFDNNISVIIRISRDGKLSAEFLPSSQVAEAYLKENLPLLKQRFEDNNIEYENLSHRERRQNNKENDRKKDHEDE